MQSIVSHTGRVRVVARQWRRDPHGPILPRDDDAPHGHRPRNSIIWAPTVADFFWVERVPGLNMLTMWSVSMLAQYGEVAGEPGITRVDIERCFPAARAVPRKRRVWPVLQLPKVHADGEYEFQSALYEAIPDEYEAPEQDDLSAGETVAPTDHSPDVIICDSDSDSDMRVSRPPTPSAAGDPFSLRGVPKLEEFIPEEFLPDILMVHDPNDVCLGTYSTTTSGEPVVPKRYRRLLPATGPDTANMNTAEVFLASSNLKGSGNHSHVYSASVCLPLPLRAAHSRNGHARVALKTAMRERGDREMLAHEARTYAALPRHLMQAYTGLNLVTPLKFPVPVGAVVPKFFGYYVPDFAEDVGTDAEPWEKSSPLLLLEDCGTPLDVAGEHVLSMDQKTECYSLFMRLHYEHIAQHSPAARNILVQPGPLSRAPHQRSMAHPSFRVIDFGRAEDWRPRFRAGCMGRSGAEEEEEEEEEVKEGDREGQRQVLERQWGLCAWRELVGAGQALDVSIV
ncbi:hypothetical protein PLICRDRAFT_52573 [Plicaturopsis crispa FD-325 SS-3]|nr:hypothetical protein PLICRDRAFT_52573 [Plicaturopsis crispa FD-325 SS-3]